MSSWRGPFRLCRRPFEACAIARRKPPNHLMKALALTLRLVLAAAAAVLGVGAFSAGSGASVKESSVGGTPLPAGWELCILQGINAPATQANVADLDEWQLA